MARQMLRVFVTQFPHNECLFRGQYDDRREIPAKTDPKTGYPVSSTDSSAEKRATKRVRIEGVKQAVNGFNVRGLVLLYTSKTPDMVAVDDMNYGRKTSEEIRPADFPSGAIVGAAEIFYGDNVYGEVYLRSIKRFPQWIPFSLTRGQIRWGKVSLELVEKQLRKVGLLRLARKSVLSV